MKQHTLSLAMILAAGSLALPAAAQAPQCAPTVEVMDTLTETWGESPVSSGLTDDDIYAVWWLNPETGTWTLTMTGTDGLTCIAGFGRNGEAHAPTPAGEAM